MGKVYAVRKGRSPGLYHTWSECERQVKGFSGAQYKSFATLAEAKEYLGEGSQTVGEVAGTATVTTTPVPSTPVPSTPISSTPPAVDGTVIYTDGSCVSRVGGYGVVFIREQQVEKYCGRVPYDPCTNNQAELYAILGALTLVSQKGPSIGPVTILSDSEYSILALTSRYIKWEKNGWRTSTGAVKNLDLIKLIVSTLRALPQKVHFEHVYGHQGNYYNEMADRLANEGRSHPKI